MIENASLWVLTVGIAHCCIGLLLIFFYGKMEEGKVKDDTFFIAFMCFLFGVGYIVGSFALI